MSLVIKIMVCVQSRKQTDSCVFVTNNIILRSPICLLRVLDIANIATEGVTIGLGLLNLSFSIHYLTTCSSGLQQRL